MAEDGDTAKKQPAAFDLMACLRASSIAPAQTDTLFESAVSDPPEVFARKFDQTVKGHMGFSLRIPK